MTGNLETAIPLNLDDYEDSEYIPKKDSAQELIDCWRKGQQQLNQFWEVWRQDYSLALRDTLPICHKNFSSQIVRQPIIGEIVLVKDENMPCRTWKLALVKEHIFSKDGQIRSVKIELPNKQILVGAINHLFPLEIMVASDQNRVKTSNDEPVLTDQPIRELNLLPRKASIQARKKIAEQMRDEPVTITFCYPGECHGVNDITQHIDDVTDNNDIRSLNNI